MPPLMFFPGFGFVCRLIMFTPSMINRFLSGFTLSTRPRLPRSLPVITSTLSFFRIGVAKLDMTDTCNSEFRILNSEFPPLLALQNLGRQGDDLHEPPLAQFAGHRSEHARADRLALVVDQHGGIAIEPDVGAVAPALFLDGPDNHGFDDLPLFDVRFGRRFLHRRRHDIAKTGIAAGGPANRVDDRDLASAGVIGDVQDRSHLNHDCFSAGWMGGRGRTGRKVVALTLPPFLPCQPFPPSYTSAAWRMTCFSAHRFRRLSGRVSTIETVSPIFASPFSSCTMNFDVRRSVLPYSPCRTCHSTATTMLFCILLLTTVPTFSDF